MKETLKNWIKKTPENKKMSALVGGIVFGYMFAMDTHAFQYDVWFALKDASVFAIVASGIGYVAFRYAEKEEEHANKDVDKTNYIKKLEEKRKNMSATEFPISFWLQKYVEDMVYIETHCNLTEEERKCWKVEVPKQILETLALFEKLDKVNKEGMRDKIISVIAEKEKMLQSQYRQPHQQHIMQLCEEKLEETKEQKHERIYLSE